MAYPFLQGNIISEQPTKGVLDAHLNTFMSVVSDLGYSPATIKTQMTLLKGFKRWAEGNHIVASNIDEGITDRFLIESDRKGAVRRGDNRTLHRFLDHLRLEGAIAHLKPTFNDSPLTHLKSRYEDYLQKERGLSAEAGSRYWPYIRRFIFERFGNKSMWFCELCPQDIDRFLLSHAREQTPKAAQLMVSAMRSFLRFLFRYAETNCDLSTAVPTVAAWRLSEVPKYIKPEVVESLLEGCDQTTSVGRRNYSILLLIARLGLRAGEIVALELGDINWRASEITIQGKGQFCDRLPLPQSVGEASTAKEPATLADRLNMVRRFAIWRSAADVHTQVPPKNLMPYRYQRKPPYIYSDEEIEKLVGAARKLSSPKGLRGPTYATLFGLIAVTGMRISEAVSLDRQDVDLEERVLNIRESKFRKSRLVPVHVTTRDALSDYAEKRDQMFPMLQSAAFFVSERGTRVTHWAARDNFAVVSRQIGIRKKIKGKRVGRGPRLHDMRHRFAAQTLVDWYRAGINVEREIHKLSTYLGHAHVNDTYWYLEAIPELLELATQKLMHEKKEAGDDD